MSHQPKTRRALLVFADDAGRDLARRKLPFAALPLLQFPSLRGQEGIDADVHVFHLGSNGRRGHVEYHGQEGTSFRTRFENAIEKLAGMGYAEVVAIGRDCPSLADADIAQAFEKLRATKLVLGPDHRGGCYLIGFRVENRALLRGIRWTRNTDCRELQQRAGAGEIALLAIKHDLDSMKDLGLAARADACVARWVAPFLSGIETSSRSSVVFVHAVTAFIRVHSQMPPPACAA